MQISGRMCAESIMKFLIDACIAESSLRISRREMRHWQRRINHVLQQRFYDRWE